MNILFSLIIFGYIAYKDYKDRIIPQWAMALSWLVYGFTLAFFTASEIVPMLLMMAIPIFGLGLLWSIQLIIEMIHKKRLIPRKLAVRLGLADVFILPLMLGILSQFGLGICLLWAVSTFGYAALWFNDLKQGQKKRGIPILTFAIFAMILCIIAGWVVGS